MHYKEIDISDVITTREEKQGVDYLVAYMDAMIGRLVNEKALRRKKMAKMRNLYDGIRDKREYKFLEDNFGIGNAGKLRFTPIIRKRIDVLIGLLSATPFDQQVTVSDPGTIESIIQEKSNALIQEVYNELVSYNQRAAQARGIVESLKSIEPWDSKKSIDKATQNIEKNWKSVYIEACNHILSYLKGNTDIDLYGKRRLIFEDYLVLGECVYRCYPYRYGAMPRVEVLLPENCYYNLRRDQQQIKEAKEFVYVHYMSTQEVLAEYGHLLSREDKETLFRLPTVKRGSVTIRPDSTTDIREDNRDWDEMMRQEVHRVYQCEWIAASAVKRDKNQLESLKTVTGPDKVQGSSYDLYRYEGVRIGETLYVNIGEAQIIRRSKLNPNNIYLTFNGSRFSARNNEPYSLVWKCKDLQDLYDIVYFIRDNLLANSGVKGTRIDLASIPLFLGADPMKRVMKFLALRKNGAEVYDSTLDGADFNHFGDFDTMVDGQSIIGINAVLAQIDDEAAQVTGVTQQMLGAIEQREAVSNVKVGMTQAALVTKTLFDNHDTVMTCLLTDYLHNTQELFADTGLKGSFMDGGKFRILSILPKHFCFTDYLITIKSSSTDYARLAELRSLAGQMVANGIMNAKLLGPILRAESLSEAIDQMDRILAETDTIGQQLSSMKSQVDDLGRQNQELQSQVKKQEDLLKRFDQMKLDLERYKIDKDFELGEKKLGVTKDLGVEANELKRETVQLERDQLFYGNGRQTEVRNNL